MESLKELIWNNQFLNNLSVIITVLSPVWALTIFFIGKSYPNVKRWITRRKALKNMTNSGIVIFTGSKDDDITNFVLSYVSKHKKLKKIPKERIKTIYLSKSSSIKKEDMPKIAEKLRIESAKLRDEGIMTKHIFIKSPVIIGAIIGSELANCGKAFLYHKDRGAEDYELWGELNK